MNLKTLKIQLFIILIQCIYNTTEQYRCRFIHLPKLENDILSHIHIIYIDYKFKCEKGSIDENLCLKSIKVYDLRHAGLFEQEQSSGEIKYNSPHPSFLIPKYKYNLLNERGIGFSDFFLYRYSPMKIFTIQNKTQRNPYKELFNYNANKKGFESFEKYAKDKNYTQRDLKNNINVMVELDPWNREMKPVDYLTKGYYISSRQTSVLMIEYELTPVKNHRNKDNWRVNFSKTSSYDNFNDLRCFKKKRNSNEYIVPEFKDQPDFTIWMAKQEEFSMFEKSTINVGKEDDFHSMQDYDSDGSTDSLTNDNKTSKPEDMNKTHALVYNDKITLDQITNLNDSEVDFDSVDITSYPNLPNRSHVKFMKFTNKEEVYCVLVSYYYLKVIELHHCKSTEKSDKAKGK